MKAQQKGNIYIFIAAFLWSLGGVLLKGVHYSPVGINGMRCLLAFFVFILYRKSIRIRINHIIVLAALALVATNLLYVIANKMTTAANAIVIQYTAPIWVLLWNCIYRRRFPGYIEIITMILAFGGTVLFFFDGLTASFVLGNLCALISGVTFSGVMFLNTLPEASSEDSSMLAFLITAIVSIPWLGEFVLQPECRSIIMVIILGVFQVGVAYIFFSKGCKLTSPVTISLIGLTEAVMNPSWVYLVFGEKVGRYALIGIACILIAVVIQIFLSERE